MTARPEIATFEDVYRAEYPRLLRRLTRRVGPDDARDFAQEAFARFHHSGKLPVLNQPGAYLNRIARNMLIDRARRRKKQDRPIFFPFEEDRDAVSRAEQTWRIEAIDLLRLYRQAVRAMPPKTRRVFVMHRIHRLTYKEIAERVGISAATVEYHMMRALTLCRAAVAVQW
ncbi:MULTISPECIES: RNA polymerase sigma factor [Sphingopyxis]|uniref:ECF subfamily RNA polymerase sigma-24 factor n=1 Tax=Sphingopyxis fribergensis TaxID=1515612 RepID=A0A0A7PJ84_9SPHN|nr:sigma-70 family RNA polymerase sigma factor [Sphingopyxis fribergensis]AJA09273.1 hypothetical protein SKP52_11885 [Sphingopyxis fribergensis]